MDSIYSIISTNKIDNKWICNVKLNPDHIIFKGHFPEFPVLPGAIQVQMVRELVESVLKKKLKLKDAGSIKFLKMIIPTKVESIEIMISIIYEDHLNVIAEFKIEGRLHCKINAVYELGY